MRTLKKTLSVKAQLDLLFPKPVPPQRREKPIQMYPKQCRHCGRLCYCPERGFDKVWDWSMPTARNKKTLLKNPSFARLLKHRGEKVDWFFDSLTQAEKLHVRASA